MIKRVMRVFRFDFDSMNFRCSSLCFCGVELYLHFFGTAKFASCDWIPLVHIGPLIEGIRNYNSECFGKNVFSDFINSSVWSFVNIVSMLKYLDSEISLWYIRHSMNAVTICNVLAHLTEHEHVYICVCKDILLSTMNLK